MSLVALVENESIKMLRRRRFAVVMIILCVILSLVAYSQQRQQARRTQTDWRINTQQRVASYQNTLRRSGISESWARSLRAEIVRLQFYLDHDIDPNTPTAPFFARNFANVAGALLLLPLLVVVLGGDIVSAERAEGTDKLLLTRPVRRWKVLASKLISLYMFTTLTLLCGGILAYLLSGIVFDLRGWDAPVFSGFQLSGEGLRFDSVRQLPLWKDTLIAYGLEWLAMISVASVSLFLSVIFRSSAASIGTMIASLIGGTIVSRMSPDWTAGKYLFVNALPLADYYSGQPPPYDGMSVMFCLGLLAVWSAAALAGAFAIFTKRDVFG